MSSLDTRITAALADTEDETTLVDLLDRLLSCGVVIQGDVMLTVAGIDLLRVGLRVWVSVPGSES